MIISLQNKPLGQINLGTERGQIIKDLASMPTVKTIVEIGTWNGYGSTQCVLAGIKDKKGCEFYTIEVNKEMYQKALRSDPKLPYVHFINGRIIEVDDFISEEYWPPAQSHNLSKWLPISIKDHDEVDNVLHMLPKNIDFLILDGGEFSTRAEWEILRDRTKFVFLDDTEALKNIANREELLESGEFDLIKDVRAPSPHDPVQEYHHGWSVFLRKDK